MIKKPARSHLFIALQGIIALFAFTLRVWNLGTQSLWYDEAWSVYSAYHPLALGAQGTDPNTPPGFYLTLSAWLHLVGDGVWALRFWSVILGVVAVALTALVVRRWFGDRAALCAALLVAASPLMWVYSQEIRAYIAVPLFALVMLILLERLLRHPDRHTWALLLLIELLALYTHNLAVALLAWLNIIVVVAWSLKKEWKRIGLWIACQAGLAVAYLPWLLTQGPTGSLLDTSPAPTPAMIWSVWQSYFTGEATLLNVDTALTALIALIGVVAVVSLVAAFAWRRSARLYLLASQALLVPVFEFAIVWGAHIEFHPRYFIAGLPAAFALIATGMETLGQTYGTRQTRASTTSRTQRLGRFPSILGPGLVSLLALAIGFQALRLTSSNPIYQHDDFRAIAEYYTRLTAQDAIVVPYGWDPTLAYYAAKLGIPAQIIGIPLNTPWQTVAQQLNALHAKRIEVLTWYQSPADLRGVYPCLLGTVTDAAPQSYTVVGITTTGYDNPQPITAQALPGQPPTFGLFNSTGTKVIYGERSACVIGEWILSHKNELTANESYRVATDLLSPLGWQFSRGDADLRDDHQVPTQFWPQGQNGTTYALLSYPVGTPAGQYPLVIGLYSAKTRRGLDVLRNGVPVGQSAQVGTLTVMHKVPDEADLLPFNFVTVAPTLSAALAVAPMNAACELQPGQQFRVSVLWRILSVYSQTALLSLRGSDWQMDETVWMNAGIDVKRGWFQFTIPARAKGEASLEVLVPGGVAQHLQTCTITPSDHLFDPPVMQQLLGVSFAGIGSLEGFDPPSTGINSGESVSIILYWRADETPSTAYTVFTHLLDVEGHVIAQDDQVPANGHHPTTGWLKDEYIADPHTLIFNAQGRGYHGTATLEIGLYDPLTGDRAKLMNGGDHVLLPVTITVR
jgi:hypothetical protein